MDHPVAWGLAGWGLGSLYYNTGYASYSNPYYSQPVDVGGGVTLDYSQPLQTGEYADTAAEEAPPDAPPAASDEGLSSFDEARMAFQRRDYDTALDSVNAALAKMPKDAVLHEFRALVLFARGDYREAAATLNAVLAVGPGWDWTTMIGLYTSVDVYSEQLRLLEAYATEHLKSADARFLLAYHYLTGGHKDAAVRQLKQVTRLAPQDTVSAQLLAMLAPPPSGTAKEAVPRAPAPEDDPPPAPGLDDAQLVGKWKAARKDGSRFDLNLTHDGKFTWTFRNQGKATTLAGTYTIDGNMLLLKDAKQGTMAGEVTPADDGSFKFHMAGTPPGDADLNFRS